MFKPIKQRGALFIEYALILAFVIGSGVTFINSDSISGKLGVVFGKTNETLEKAAGNAAFQYPNSKTLKELVEDAKNGDLRSDNNDPANKWVISNKYNEISNYYTDKNLSPVLLNNNKETVNGQTCYVLCVPLDAINSLSDFTKGQNYTFRQYAFGPQNKQGESLYTGYYRDVQATVKASGSGATLHYFAQDNIQAINGGTLEWISE